MLVLFWLKRVIQGILILLAILILAINVGFYGNPAEDKPDVTAQLRFLARALHIKNAAREAQSLYPEGFMFMHALYGLSWCEAISDSMTAVDLKEEGLREIHYALDQMDSREAKSIFNAQIAPAYGVFYRGWTAYLRGKYLEINRRDTAALQQFELDCADLSHAATISKEPYLESYEGRYWPADNIVGLAALSLHDRITTPLFSAEIEIWLHRIQQSAAASGGFIPHSYTPGQSASMAQLRGSSQALMLCFLPEIDPGFARTQFQLFKNALLDDRIGLPGIREYPEHITGDEDIDSGPVVTGIGGAASIVAIRAAALQQDWALATALKREVDVLLFPRHSGTQKSYLFEKLPVLDAFMVWVNAAYAARPEGEPGLWRLRFQFISFITLLLMAWLFIRLRHRGQQHASP